MRTPEIDAASAVTAYLTHSQYGGDSPLQRLIQEHIGTLAREVAAEIVASTPQLREKVEELTTRIVREALEDDDQLRRTVVTAVAGALAVRRRELEDE